LLHSQPAGSWSRRLRLAAGAAAAALCLLIMVCTEPSLAIVWDEGYSLGREERVRAWLSAMWDPATFAQQWQPPIEDLTQPNHALRPAREQLATRAGLLSPDVLEWFWPFAREEPDGHPPFYALVGLVGDLLTPSWEPLPRARMGPMIVFSLTCGAIFVFCETRWGIWSAALTAGTWILQPHLFALAHYATYDGLLASLWVASTLCFAKAVEPGGGSGPARVRWGWAALFGALTGCALATKLTGWFLPLPFLAWSILYRDRRALVTLGTGLVVAGAVLVVQVPPWWHNPLVGWVRFFQSNLTRATTMPVKILFLGTTYDTPGGSLPWYNTVVWTVLVTPVGFLVLGSAGAIRAAVRVKSDRTGMLFLVHWAFLLALRALPHTPGHDGVRQFLPAIGMLALLAALGAESAVRRLGAWGKSFIVLALLEGAVSVALLMPVPLSYYSPLVGGLPGATRLGMEPTFYWDALGPEVLDWLNEHTAPRQKVRFARYPTSWLYLRQTHQLRVGILPTEPGDWAWYVVQNRPGGLFEVDRHLIEQGHPAFVYKKFGVPLLWVFPYDEVAEWQTAEPPRK
jgi:4-amino-4-deoxy-L-arabinose transferase-like glycosyltransferase